MTYIATVKTGKKPINVRISKPELICGAGKAFKLKKGAEALSESFEAITIPAEEMFYFLEEYSRKRNLQLGYSNGVYVLYNNRHNTFRFLFPSEGKYDLLTFIEPEFITIKRK